MICPYCNFFISDGSVQCTNCGKQLVIQQYSQQIQPQYGNQQIQMQTNGQPAVYQSPQQNNNMGYQQPTSQMPVVDKVNALFIILSVLFPIVGFILSVLAFSQNRIRSGKVYLITSIIAAILAVIAVIVLVIVLPIVGLANLH